MKQLSLFLILTSLSFSSFDIQAGKDKKILTHDERQALAKATQEAIRTAKVKLGYNHLPLSEQNAAQEKVNQQAYLILKKAGFSVSSLTS